ncbi:MAG: HD-GYP domain-containing protein [Phycisphaerales bacterium]|nr:HD-GYP domain-containing protein [Phycisphaerales bacterium]
MTHAASPNPLDRPDLREVLTHLALRCHSLPAAVMAAGPALEDPRVLENQFAWLFDLLGGAPEVVKLVTAQFGCEIESARGLALEAPLLLIVLPILQRRRRVGQVVCLTPERELANHPMLASLAVNRTPGGSDPRAQLLVQPLPDRSAVPTLIQAIDWWLHDLCELREAAGHIESFGRQLTDAYEELALLQKVSRNMNVVRQPRQFLDSVCKDLLEVMPYRWTALKLSEKKQGCDDFADLLFRAGDLTCDRQQLLRVINGIISTRCDGKPIVREEGLTCDCPELESLERSIIVQPLADDDVVYGALVAGGKIGEEAQVNSFDLKILGATAEHVRIFLDNVGLYDGLQKMFLGTLEAITASIDAKDRYTCGHSRRVAYLSRELAIQAGLDHAVVERVHIAGLVHDVGKIGVPEAVLSKPGRLTDDEFDMIKKHPEIGVRILRDIPNFDDIIPGVMSHHERFDGRGYPHQLKGSEIPLFGRIVGIADAFDAMSSTRTYRRALSSDDVLAEMRRCAGSQFDPDLIPHFLRINFAVYEQMRDHDRALEQQSGVAA